MYSEKPSAASIDLGSCAAFERIVAETGSSVYEVIVLRGRTRNGVGPRRQALHDVLPCVVCRLDASEWRDRTAHHRHRPAHEVLLRGHGHRHICGPVAFAPFHDGRDSMLRGYEVRVVTKHEDDGRDTRTSNWTLATGTLPVRRDVQAPMAAMIHPTAEKTTS